MSSEYAVDAYAARVSKNAHCVPKSGAWLKGMPGLQDGSWVDMLAACIAEATKGNPSRLFTMDVVKSCGIVPLTHSKAALVDDFWKGAEGTPVDGVVDSEAIPYGDLHEVDGSVFLGTMLFSKSEPTTILPFGMHATPSFRSPLQLCTFVADLSHLDSTDKTEPKLVRDLLAKIESGSADGGRVIQTHGRATIDHPLLNTGDHSSSSRLLLTPCVWMGVSGFRLDISRTLQIVTTSRDSMFVPVTSLSFSQLVALCRKEVLYSLNKAARKFEASDDARRTTLLRCIMDKGIRFKDSALFDEVYDTSRWISMNTDTIAERCMALARLMEETVDAGGFGHSLDGQITALVTGIKDTLDVDREWLDDVLDSSVTVKERMGTIFTPVARRVLPSDSHDPSFCDIHLLTHPFVTNWQVAKGVTQLLFDSLLYSVYTMVPPMDSEALLAPLPFTSLLVRNAAGSTLTHARGTPYRYHEDPVRFLQMPPDQHCTLSALQGLMHLIPNVTNRREHVISVLRNTGGFGPMTMAENGARGGIEFYGLVNAPPAPRQSAVSIESLYAVKEIAKQYANDEAERRKSNASKPKKVKKPAAEKPAAAPADVDSAVIGLAAGTKPALKRRPAPPRAKAKAKAQAQALKDGGNKGEEGQADEKVKAEDRDDEDDSDTEEAPAAKKSKTISVSENSEPESDDKKPAKAMDLDDHWDLDDDGSDDGGI